MKPISDRCIYATPWCGRISQLFTGDRNYRLRNQEIFPLQYKLMLLFPHRQRSHLCHSFFYTFTFSLYWNFNKPQWPLMMTGPISTVKVFNFPPLFLFFPFKSPVLPLIIPFIPFREYCVVTVHRCVCMWVCVVHCGWKVSIDSGHPLGS